MSLLSVLLKRLKGLVRAHDSGSLPGDVNPDLVRIQLLLSSYSVRLGASLSTAPKQGAVKCHVAGRLRS